MVENEKKNAWIFYERTKLLIAEDVNKYKGNSRKSNWKTIRQCNFGKGMSQSVAVAITKYHRLRDLINIYFSQFWRLKFQIRMPAWSRKGPILAFWLHLHMLQEAGELSEVSFIKALISFMRDPTKVIRGHLPKVSSTNTITLRMWLQHRNSGDTH